MSTNFAIIGGDLRIVELAKLLAKDGNTIYTYALEKAEELKDTPRVFYCKNIVELAKNAKIIIGPIPFSSDGKYINTPFSEEIISIQSFINEINSNLLIAGSIPQEIYNFDKSKNLQIIDIINQEELAVLNTISTAEGTIEIAIANTTKTIHGSNILILGFGRVAKTLASKMLGLSANITCGARKNEDFAWMKAYGYKTTNINTLGENLSQYDIIINTVPHLILTERNLQYVKKDCLLIDLASKPGGIDRQEAKKRNLKLIWALALPGKVAPVTTAEFIKNTIYNIL